MRHSVQIDMSIVIELLKQINLQQNFFLLQNFMSLFYFGLRKKTILGIDFVFFFCICEKKYTHVKVEQGSTLTTCTNH